MQKESIRELATETVDANKQIANSFKQTNKQVGAINESLKEIASTVSKEVAHQIEVVGEKQAEIISKFQGDVDKHLTAICNTLIITAESFTAAVLSDGKNQWREPG